MILSREKIVELCAESFDKGATSAMESLIRSLEELHQINPKMSFQEVIANIKEMKSRSKITNGNAE